MPDSEFTASHIEAYAAAWAGHTVILPEKPISEVETYLAKIAGQNVDIPASGPTSRLSAYLAEILNSADSGNSSSGQDEGYSAMIDAINGEVI